MEKALALLILAMEKRMFSKIFRWALVIGALNLAIYPVNAAKEEKSDEDSHKSNEKDPEAAIEAVDLKPSRNYKHQWIPFSTLTAKAIGQNGQIKLGHHPGQLDVLVFIASWCVGCQEVIESIQAIERQYEKAPVKFTYIFVHDTISDAEGFYKEYGLSRALLADHEILKTFKNPLLPSIYLSDRKGWMLHRYLDFKSSDLSNLSHVLKTLTAY